MRGFIHCKLSVFHFKELHQFRIVWRMIEVYAFRVIQQDSGWNLFWAKPIVCWCRIDTKVDKEVS